MRNGTALDYVKIKIDSEHEFSKKNDNISRMF